MKKKLLRHICAVVIIITAIFTNNIAAFAADENSVDRESIYSPEEIEYIQNCGKLKVGYVVDRKPVSFKDDNDELCGISRDIFDRIAQISGLQFDYVALPEGDVTYDYLIGENFDLVTSVEYNKENQKAKGILISDPYLSSRKVIVAKPNFRFDMNVNYKVAISTGSQTLRKVIKKYYPNYDLVDYPSTEACFSAVQSGEADLLIQNQYVVEYWLYKPIYNSMKAIPVVELNDQLCFSAVTPLEKDTSGIWQEKEMQINIINKAIAAMSDAEVAGFVITSIMENMYRYTYGDILYQYRYTVIALGLALVLIVILLHANMKIRLRSMRDRADAAAKGEFLSAMGHEIRTPINGLIGLNYMIGQNLDDKDKITDYLKQSASVTQYLLSLVNNILDMSNIQDNKIVSEREPLDLLALVTSAQTLEKSAFEDKDITFNTDIEIEYPVILGDEMHIRQILVNMLDNAGKYTDNGGNVTLKIYQEKLSDKEIKTVMAVIDNGKGMSDEFQKKIFEPFTQERGTVSLGNQGTGLGMAISSMLAKSMGGSLSVKSKLGEGSEFTFEFTAEPTSLPAENKEDSENTPTDENLVKPNILIAEDNDLNSVILIEILTNYGYKVARASNGKEAVTMFEESEIGEYGVILMDLLMPELNGFEATKEIRAAHRPDAKTVKIIACTANSFKEDQENAFKCGMDGFLAKPINVELLLKKLEHFSKPE